MNKVDDKELMRQVQNGNVNAFSTLYKRYKAPLYYFILDHIKDVEFSKDLLQSTFERSWKYKGSFKLDQNFKTWLFTIAKNRIKDHWHKGGSVHVQGIEEAIININEQETFQSEILGLLYQLDQADQELIHDFYFKNMAHREIADRLGISENNSRIRLCRAVKKLSELYKK